MPIKRTFTYICATFLSDLHHACSDENKTYYRLIFQKDFKFHFQY